MGHTKKIFKKKKVRILVQIEYSVLKKETRKPSKGFKVEKELFFKRKRFNFKFFAISNLSKEFERLISQGS